MSTQRGGSADSQCPRKGSWARRGVKDAKLIEQPETENEKKVVERETGTREGEERISSSVA